MMLENSADCNKKDPNVVYLSLNSSSSLSSSSTSSSIEPAKEEELTQTDTEAPVEINKLNTVESSSVENKPKNFGRISKIIEDDSSSVKVGIRIRPQSIRERIELCKICTSVTPGEPQVTLGHKDDKTFTYDYVFDIGKDQENVFDKSVKTLIDGCFDGYNATVLAYGQTGSGKTYTMGTSFDPSIQREEVGIIPRAIEYMFEKVESLKNECSKEENDLPFNNLEIQVLAQFMELYNEEIIDLFANVPSVSYSSNIIATDGQIMATEAYLLNKNNKSKIEIHEDQYGGINVHGCSNREVRSTQETLEMLKTGARIRTTGATNMNLQSSRSHAIFTIHLKQYRFMKTDSAENELETLNAKFHFVDLAGSERLKRTGATGHRAKEGICINRGLLALGNVISALGDKEKRGCHVPYRDSKLTRLLQDSLGGNSRTLMIACISPSDRDFMETLNTLRYANRARNIKNKVFVNQDKTSKQIAQLKAEIERLNYELMQYKSRAMNKTIFPHSETSNSISSSRTTSTITITPIASCSSSIANGFGINSDSKDIELLNVINELKQENSLLLKENQSMRIRIKAMNETIETSRNKNSDLEFNNQRLAKKLNSFRQKYAHNDDDDDDHDEKDNHFEWKQISDYITTIEELKCKLQESESICKQLQLQQSKHNSNPSYSLKLKQDEEETNSNNLLQSIDLTAVSNKKLIDEAKKDIESDLARLKQLESKFKLENSLNSDQDIASAQANKDEEDEKDENLNDLIQLYTDLNENDDPESGDKSEPCKLIEKNLNNIILKIDIKKRLIDELENNSQNLEVLRVQYEENMSLLHDRIKQIEDERDRVLANMTKQSADSRNDEQIKKIKLEYELKIKSLQSDLNKYEQIKSKNQQMIKNALESEKQLQQLRKEIVDMKKLKVKLMNQLRDETQKSKQDEQRRMREIAILKRDHLKKDNQIKSLEAEKRCRDIVLKRKQEQIQALRKFNSNRIQSERPPSTRISQSVDSEATRSQTSTARKHTQSSFMSKRTATYQIKWTKINDFINAIVVKKQTISLIEREMERFLEQRERISRKLNRLLKRYEKALIHESNMTNLNCLSTNSTGSSTTSSDAINSKSGIEPNKLEEIKEQIDIMKSNIEYLQDQIAECQTNIIQLDEAKDGTDYYSLENLVLTIGSIDEAKFMIRKFLNLALNKGVLAAQKEYLNNELEYELNQLEKDFNVQQNLVQQIIQSGQISEELAKQILANSESCKPLPTNNNLNLLNECDDNFEIDEIILAPIMDDSSSESEEDEEITRMVEQDTNQLKSYENLISPVSSNNHNSSGQLDSSYKARQVITSGPQDLLFVSTSTSNASTEINIKTSQTIKVMSPVSGLIQQSGRIDSKSYTKIPEIVDSKKSITDCSNIPMSKSVIVQPVDRNNSRMTRSSISRHNSKDSVMSMSPPGSPNYKRMSSRDNNVFNRLTSETKQSPKPEQGVIKPYSGNTSRFRSSPILLTHVAEGHSKAILSIDSYEYQFFTSSKDSTAKVWDLTTGQETSSLGGHTNNVIKIKYCPYTKLCFTVSNYYAKVWDLRESNKRCVKTLCSSGLANDGDYIVATGQIKTNTRVLQNEMPFGEKLINDISLDKYGYNLFTASGSSVKIWDLRQFLPIGKLSGGHSSSITTMLVDDNLLITGSKDHYIKIFEINSFYSGNNDINNGKVISPKYHLTPPHYDGVQSLCRIDNCLFSCSRDMCIKKWSMDDFQCKQSMNNAHKDWIHSLDYIKNYTNKYDLLLSGSRDGCLKFWNANTFEKIADFKAHLCPIISIKVNNNLVFTGSEDATVRIWRRDK